MDEISTQLIIKLSNLYIITLILGYILFVAFKENEIDYRVSYLRPKEMRFSRLIERREEYDLSVAEMKALLKNTNIAFTARCFDSYETTISEEISYQVLIEFEMLQVKENVMMKYFNDASEYFIRRGDFNGVEVIKNIMDGCFSEDVYDFSAIDMIDDD
jgi:hypothetical protein